MNEKTVLKSSLYVFFAGCILFGIVSLLTKDISYLLGIIVGYVINVLVFLIIIKMTDLILQMSMSTIIVVMMFFVKLLLYAVGFLLAVKTSYVHILSVFCGYLITKITIFIEGYVHKGGEVDG